MRGRIVFVAPRSIDTKTISKRMPMATAINVGKPIGRIELTLIAMIASNRGISEANGTGAR
jgi:hypothetical protein